VKFLTGQSSHPKIIEGQRPLGGYQQTLAPLCGMSALRQLESLCTLFGMGLVLFKRVPGNPQFEKRGAARKFEPDMFYVNEFARRLQQTDQQAFNRLFTTR
jgi:hypothetical protein